MAAMAGTAREMVGRALKVLEVAGAIQMQHGRIEVLSRDRLLVLVLRALPHSCTRCAGL